MKRSTTRLMMLALFVAAGCSGITTNANVAPGANLAKYHTYAWAPRPGDQMESPGEQQVRAALQRDLAQKGIVPATTQPPDFLVAYHARQQEKIEATPGYGWGYGWYGYPAFETYTQGTLIVDFVDPQTNQVFWRGTASGVVEHPNNPDLAKIDKAVAKLINQYPGTMAATGARTTM